MIAGRDQSSPSETESLRFWLSGSHVDEPTTGAAEWFSERLGMFRKQVEAFSLAIFMSKLANLFAVLELKSIVFVEVDRHTVYSDEDNAKKTHDLGIAAAEVQSYLSSANHEHNHLVFSALEEEVGSHLMVVAQYWQKHPVRDWPFEITVTGIPSELMLKDNETEGQYWLRMGKPLLTEYNLERAMSTVLDHYLSETEKSFEVERSEKHAVGRS